MTLFFFLNRQISPEIAAQTRSNRWGIPILSLYEWLGGDFVGADDSLILHSATQEGLTLVTYDRRTIPPILVKCKSSCISHVGILLR